jgi:hypothetical protein
MEAKRLLEYMESSRDHQVRSIYTDLELLQINHERVSLYVMKLEVLIKGGLRDLDSGRSFDFTRSLENIDKALQYLKIAEKLWHDVSAKTLISLGDEETTEALKAQAEDC